MRIVIQWPAWASEPTKVSIHDDKRDEQARRAAQMYRDGKRVAEIQRSLGLKSRATTQDVLRKIIPPEERRSRGWKPKDWRK